jgi:hypothetical protein
MKAQYIYTIIKFRVTDVLAFLIKFHVIPTVTITVLPCIETAVFFSV